MKCRGAGTILHARGAVTGLTSAATIWVVAAIGIAIGGGAYIDALGTTLIVMLVLYGLGYVERLVGRHATRTHLVIHAKADTPALEELETYLNDAVMSGVSSVRILHGKGTGALRAAVRERDLAMNDVGVRARRGAPHPHLYWPAAVLGSHALFCAKSRRRKSHHGFLRIAASIDKGAGRIQGIFWSRTTRFGFEGIDKNV